MPEGDTILQAATRLREAFDGAVLEAVEGSHPDVRREGRRLVGHRVTGVESVGKHLLVHVDRGWSLRTHLGMPGSWHLYREGERWRRSPGAARVVLRSGPWVAVCFAAPSVQIAPTPMVLERIGHLGPDTIDDDFDAGEAVRRAGRLSDDTPAIDIVLDQRVMAGVGNVFANEILFLEGIHPLRLLGTLDDAALSALVARAHRLLRANRSPGSRATTGSSRRGEELWVYGRSGRPCRRCGTPLAQGRGGANRRVITWCPSCQGAAA
ncbi:MAG TPA: DNA-formamidopyrimidine glycosylase family protein [Acidimicrobiia bacterium]|nr:DNA-formamidopyrimidine glycosylase family protein [Acidimicrobiia bacterium]